MRDVPAIDSTDMHALRDIVGRSRRDGTLILLSDVHAQPLIALGRSALLDELGVELVFGNLDDALLGRPIEARPEFAKPRLRVKRRRTAWPPSARNAMRAQEIGHFHPFGQAMYGANPAT